MLEVSAAATRELPAGRGPDTDPDQPSDISEAELSWEDYMGAWMPWDDEGIDYETDDWGGR